MVKLGYVTDGMELTHSDVSLEFPATCCCLNGCQI